jgi:hypothetical protein
MRRRHFSGRVWLAAWVVALGGARAVIAQSTSGEGAIEFLLPTGARSSGMGQAVVASAVGSEALWWNPALIARSSREAGLHVSKILTIDTDASGAILIPVQRVGTFALGIRYLNEGTSPAVDSTGNQTGTFTTTATIIGATFASPITSRLALGLTYKLLRLGFNCTGTCQEPGHVPQTIALDLGAQYVLMKDSSLAFGFALTNAGPKFQVHDASQADALPVRADFGVSVAPRLDQLPKEARVRAGADLVSRVSGGYTPGFRIGAELAWLERYQARGGYVVNGPTGSGATFGLGFSTGKLQIDLARLLLNNISASDSPTYLSLRYLF